MLAQLLPRSYPAAETDALPHPLVLPVHLGVCQIFSGASLNALGFRYSDGSSQSVGRIHADAKPKATLQLAPGDRLDRIEVRSGWVSGAVGPGRFGTIVPLYP